MEFFELVIMVKLFLKKNDKLNLINCEILF